MFKSIVRYLGHAFFPTMFITVLIMASFGALVPIYVLEEGEFSIHDGTAWVMTQDTVCRKTYCYTLITVDEFPVKKGQEFDPNFGVLHPYNGK